MTENKENPKCERCGEVPTKVYNPSTPGFPTKRISLCDKCAAKDDKAILVAGLASTPDVSETVPDIAPAVPGDDNVVETKEFGPKPAEPNVAPPEPKVPTPETHKDLGPVPPDVLKQKLAQQEKDHDTLVGQRQQLQDKLAQINSVIMVKRGAIAQLRDLLGNAKS